MQHPSSAHHRRRAFTILELIISTVLMALLLAGTWGLLGIYQGQFEKSQDRVERWQLIRSLQQQLADDLKACHVSVSDSGMPDDASQAIPDTPADFAAREAESPAVNLPGGNDLSSAATGSDQPGTGTVDTERFAMDRVESAASPLLHQWMIPAVGLEGTHNALMLDILAPSDPRDAHQAMGLKPSDKVVRVVYAFVDPLSATVQGRPAGLVRCEWKSHELQSLSAINGGDVDLYALIDQIKSHRPEASSRALHTDVPSAGDDRHPAANSTLSLLGAETVDRQRLDKDVDQRIDLIPELTSLQLSYYDGHQWHSSWSYSQQLRLPVAVEMRFDLEKPASTKESEDANPHAAAQRLLRERNKAPAVVQRPIDDRIHSSQAAAPVGYRWLVYLGGQEQGPESGHRDEGVFASRD